MVGLAADQGLNATNLVQGGGIAGMVGLSPGAVQLATGSPANQVSGDKMGKSNGDTSSVSPVPYVFNGGMRGRKSGAVEKVIERRQRRMIKNRESAARSRARKQVNFFFSYYFAIVIVIEIVLLNLAIAITVLWHIQAKTYLDARRLI